MRLLLFCPLIVPEKGASGFLSIELFSSCDIPLENIASYIVLIKRRIQVENLIQDSNFEFG